MHLLRLEKVCLTLRTLRLRTVDIDLIINIEKSRKINHFYNNKFFL